MPKPAWARAAEALRRALAAGRTEVAAVTRGERGVLWLAAGMERAGEVPAFPVEAANTTGAGDVFHGAYVASYLDDPAARWIDHFRFARAASAFKVQHLGNEAGLPGREDVARMREKYERA